MARRFGPLDLVFIALAVVASVGFVVSEVKLLPNPNGQPMPADTLSMWTTVNMLSLCTLGFGMLSALGPKSPGGLVLFVAAILGSVLAFEGLGFHRFDWVVRLTEVLYPPSFPYILLLFVSTGFALAMAQLVVGRRAPERASRLFFLGGFGLNGTSTVLAIGIVEALMRSRHIEPGQVRLLWLTTVPPLVSGLLLFHRMWTDVQDGAARTSPAAAVTRLFIPFYNLYWIFVVLPGFADEYNRYLRQHDLKLRPLRRGTLVAYCIVALGGGVALVIASAQGPIPAFVLSAALLVFGRKVFGDLCAAVNALAQARASSGSEIAR